MRNAVLVCGFMVASVALLVLIDRRISPTVDIPEQEPLRRPGPRQPARTPAQPATAPPVFDGGGGTFAEGDWKQSLDSAFAGDNGQAKPGLDDDLKESLAESLQGAQLKSVECKSFCRVEIECDGQVGFRAIMEQLAKGKKPWPGPLFLTKNGEVGTKWKLSGYFAGVGSELPGPQGSLR